MINQSVINPDHVIPQSCYKEWGGSIPGAANSDTHRDRASNINEWAGLGMTIGSGGDCGELETHAFVYLN